MSALLNPTLEEFTDIENLISYPAGIIMAVATFFLTMMSTHNVLVEAKNEKLREVRLRLAGMFHELQPQKGSAGELEDWLRYEQRIKEAPEWPYTTRVLRNFLVSLLLLLLGPLKDLLLDLFNRIISSQ